MKISTKFLCGLICAVFTAPAMAAVATTAGHNLTAYNGTGATNNNQWNSMMNGRAGMGTTAPKADFGNCNAVILRCAQPKCANGGCANDAVARSIVTGCVNSNESCKQYGDDLIEYLTGQMVAQSSAKLVEQQNAVEIAKAQAEAQANANAAAAAQNNAQMEQMQRQMEQMQAQMTESMAGIQEQMNAQNERQIAQARSAEPTPAPSNSGTVNNSIPEIPGLSTEAAAALARNNNIDPDILVREQIGGEIHTQIENAMLEMDKLKKQLDDIIEYAGCDPSASNCTGPKRVKKFKDMANQFFEPYENVVDNMYDALVTAMQLGVDVGDVLMLLSDSCNMWGKYNCDRCEYGYKRPENTYQVIIDGVQQDRDDCSCRDKNNEVCYHRVRVDGDGKVLPKQPYCRQVGMIQDKEMVYREWIDQNSGSTGATQVACTSDIIANYGIFKNRKKNATLDIETLRELVNQDSRACKGKMEGGKFVLTPDSDPMTACWMNRCAVDMGDEFYNELEQAARTRKLPKTKSPSSTKVANVLCYTNERNLPSANGTNVSEIGVSGCAVYSVSYLCDADDKCNWLGGKCVPKTINTNLNFNSNIVTDCSYSKYDDCENDTKCHWYDAGNGTGFCVELSTYNFAKMPTKSGTIQKSTPQLDVCASAGNDKNACDNLSSFCDWSFLTGCYRK